MERLWSQARATSRNQLQMAPLRKRLKQADRQPVATHGNRFRAHGKEGVNAEALSKSTVPNPVPNQTSRPDTASSRNQKRPALRAFSRMGGTGLEPVDPSLSIAPVCWLLLATLREVGKSHGCRYARAPSTVTVRRLSFPRSFRD
jgi:hypothetical protein